MLVARAEDSVVCVQLGGVDDGVVCVTRWCGQQCGLHVTKWWTAVWFVSPGGVASNVICVSPGGMDNSVRLWDLARVMEEQDPETDSNIPSSLNV